MKRELAYKTAKTIKATSTNKHLTIYGYKMEKTGKFRYALPAKYKIIKDILSNKYGVLQVSHELGIAISTLYRWLRDKDSIIRKYERYYASK